MIQEVNQAEKRQGAEEKLYEIFRNTKHQKREDKEFEECLNQKEMEEKAEAEPEKSEDELKKEWEERVAEMEERMRREEEEREQRQKKARKIQQSYDLLRMCKEMMEKEGVHWAKSKERREYERGKAERMRMVEVKKKTLNEKEARKKMQQSITETLEKLPENRQKLIKMEEVKERRMMLQEA